MSAQFMMDCVRMFHTRYGVSPQQQMYATREPLLIEAGEQVLKISAKLEKLMAGNPDMRFLRGHLCLEEPAEMLVAMGEGDERKAFDGLLDDLYVTFGTAVTFDWPVDAGFAEVHQSNMTKNRRSDDPGRVRDKGVQFRPPDLARVLFNYREGLLPQRRKMSVPDGMDALARDEQQLIVSAVQALTGKDPGVRNKALEKLKEIANEST